MAVEPCRSQRKGGEGGRGGRGADAVSSASRSEAADTLGQKRLQLLQRQLPDAACLWLN